MNCATCGRISDAAWRRAERAARRSGSGSRRRWLHSREPSRRAVSTARGDIPATRVHKRLASGGGTVRGGYDWLSLSGWSMPPSRPVVIYPRFSIPRGAGDCSPVSEDRCQTRITPAPRPTAHAWPRCWRRCGLGCGSGTPWRRPVPRRHRLFGPCSRAPWPRRGLVPPPPVSHRRWLGRPIVAAKRFVYRFFMRWYLAPLVEQQTAFNQSVAVALRELAARQGGTAAGAGAEVTGRVSRNRRLLTYSVQGLSPGVAPPSHIPEMRGRRAVPVGRRSPDYRHQTLVPGHER